MKIQIDTKRENAIENERPVLFAVFRVKRHLFDRNKYSNKWISEAHLIPQKAQDRVLDRIAGCGSAFRFPCA